ncbi:glutathione S-transferase [Nemania sp. FL0031]|nr:glutathione S-transferase [Nemania sp. FL0031]
MDLKPIKLYWREAVPNPSKILIILEELNLPYETSYVEYLALKEEPYTDVNPNGRTGAIILYLIERYDKGNKISYNTPTEKYLTQQWLFFQVSGQGPYFGQAAWFNIYHERIYHESPESAKVRYGNEVKRIAGVLNGVLEKSKWLVGDKCTYADLAFTTWNMTVEGFMESRTGEHAWDPTEFPHFTRWYNDCCSRDSVKRVQGVMQQKEVKSGQAAESEKEVGNGKDVKIC